MILLCLAHTTGIETGRDMQSHCDIKCKNLWYRPLLRNRRIDGQLTPVALLTAVEMYFITLLWSKVDKKNRQRDGNSAKNTKYRTQSNHSATLSRGHMHIHPALSGYLVKQRKRCTAKFVSARNLTKTRLVRLNKGISKFPG